MIILQTLFETMGEIATQFADFITRMFNDVIAIFYNNEQVTTMGVILLLGVVVGAFWFVLSWLRRLITIRNRG